MRGQGAWPQFYNYAGPTLYKSKVSPLQFFYPLIFVTLLIHTDFSGACTQGQTTSL